MAYLLDLDHFFIVKTEIKLRNMKALLRCWLYKNPVFGIRHVKMVLIPIKQKVNVSNANLFDVKKEGLKLMIEQRLNLRFTEKKVFQRKMKELGEIMNECRRWGGVDVFMLRFSDFKVSNEGEDFSGGIGVF